MKAVGAALWWIVALAALGAWILDPLRFVAGPVKLSISLGWKPVAALIAVTLLLRSKSRIRLAVFTTILTLYLLEGTLALVGLESGAPAIVVREDVDAGDTRGDGMVDDPYLLWRFKPGAQFRGREVNRLGFLDRPVEPAKREGTRRIICLGDSCTAQGMPTYTRTLHDMLQSGERTGTSWEVVNMGVHGYSVRQGLALFRQQAKALSPDIVTIYYGWNDHWLAEKPDRERMAVESKGWRGELLRRLSRRLVFSALTHTLKRPLAEMAVGEKSLRVPPDDYRACLTQLVREIRRAGATPVIITAPRAGALAQLLVHTGTTPSIDEAIRHHDHYNTIAREVAATTGAPMFDLAETFTHPDYARYFSKDGIHFTQEGLARIAEELQQWMRHTLPHPWP